MHEETRRLSLVCYSEDRRPFTVEATHTKKMFSILDMISLFFDSILFLLHFMDTNGFFFFLIEEDFLLLYFHYIQSQLSIYIQFEAAFREIKMN